MEIISNTEKEQVQGSTEKINFNGIKKFVEKNMLIDENVDVLYQYTNIEALFNGIIVKDNKGDGKDICLWASDCGYMNDPMELKSGNEFLKELTGLDLSVDGDLSGFYSTSFSTVADILPMWNMYGKNGSGICLGFNKKIVMDMFKDRIYKCLYLTDDTKSKLKALMKGYKPTGNPLENDVAGLTLLFLIAWSLLKDKRDEVSKAISQTFLPAILLMTYGKNKAYDYENEIRLLDSTNTIDDREVKYRCQNNLIVPYIENYLPKEALTEIWIGPTNDMERTKKSIMTYLRHKGFVIEKIKIIHSEVPYRG